MVILLTIIHVLIAILLILAVLLQAGKGGGLAASLGGGLSSSSVLGGRAASTFLSKATTILASAFLVSCLVLSVAYDASDEEPTTASERLLENAAAAPAPFGEPAGGAAPATPADAGENPSVLGEGTGQAEGEAE